MSFANVTGNSISRNLLIMRFFNYTERRREDKTVRIHAYKTAHILYEKHNIVFEN